MQNLLSRLSRNFDIPVPSSDERRRQQLLNILLWIVGVMDAILLFAVVGLDIFASDKTKVASDTNELNRLLLSLGVMLVFILLLIFINWKISSLAASIIFLTLLLAGIFSDTPVNVVAGRSLLYFAIPIIVSSLLIRSWASFITAFISCIAVTIIAISVGIVPDVSAMAGFWVLATTIWMATLNLESYVKKLGEVNAELLDAKNRLQEQFLDTDAELQRTNERLNELVLNSPAMIYSANATSTTFVSGNVNGLMGYTPGDFTSDAGFWQEHLHPEDRPFVHGSMEDLYRQGNLVSEYRFLHADGSYRWMRDEERLVKDESGNSLEIVGSWIDITKEKEARLALQESEERYSRLVNRSPDAIILIINGQAVFANAAAANLLGLTDINELIGRRVLDFVLPEYHSKIIERRQVIQENDSTSGLLEYKIIRKDGTLVDVSSASTAIPYQGQQAIQVALRNISAQKQVERALMDSEERYRTLSEAGKDIIFIVDRQGRFEYVNQTLAQAFDRFPYEIIGMRSDQLFPPPIAERHERNQVKVFDTGEALLVEEINKFPGGERWMSVWLVPMKNQAGEVISIMGVGRDIGKLKLAEAALTDANNLLEQRVAERTADLEASHQKLRQLTQTIVHAQEDERRRVSRELHDEAGQALVGLKMSVDQVLSEIPKSQADLRGKISRVIDELSILMRDIRALAHGLRPTALDVAGINIALSGLCQEVSEQTHLDIHYAGVDLPGLPDEVSITLYRFVQEALTNIVKHAHAATVRVRLVQHPESIGLIVMDDGHGFDLTTLRISVGLHGMEERINLLGGQFKINSAPGRGTSIRAFIPFKASPPNTH